VTPQVTVCDANGNPVAAQVLSNDPTSGYVVQVLNPVANATYYFGISANASTGTMPRTYLLGVNFSQTPIVLQTITNNTVSSTTPVNVTYFQSNEVQLFDFVLSVNSASAAPGISVELQIFDANANLVTTLICQNGQTVSGNVLLGTGVYAARFIAFGANHAVIPATSYSLLGISLTNPLDPIPVNPTNPTTTTTSTTTTTTITDPTTLVVVVPTTAPTLPLVPTLLPGAPGAPTT
jgi:hypothetical protein